MSTFTNFATAFADATLEQLRQLEPLLSIASGQAFLAVVNAERAAGQVDTDGRLDTVDRMLLDNLKRARTNAHDLTVASAWCVDRRQQLWARDRDAAQ